MTHPRLRYPTEQQQTELGAMPSIPMGAAGQPGRGEEERLKPRYVWQCCRRSVQCYSGSVTEKWQLKSVVTSTSHSLSPWEEASPSPHRPLRGSEKDHRKGGDGNNQNNIRAEVGSQQVCAGQRTGCEAAIRAVRKIFDEPGCDAVLMGDASNVINNMNRKATLHKDQIPQLCHVHWQPDKQFMWQANWQMRNNGIRRGHHPRRSENIKKT